MGSCGAKFIVCVRYVNTPGSMSRRCAGCASPAKMIAHVRNDSLSNSKNWSTNLLGESGRERIGEGEWKEEKKTRLVTRCCLKQTEKIELNG